MRALTSSAEDAILLLEATAEGLVMLFFPEEKVGATEPETAPVQPA